MVAHVHAEAVPGGDGAEFALGVLALLVKAGGVVVMAVHGVEVPVVELLALGVGIRDAQIHGTREQLVKRGDAGEPPRASEDMKGHAFN